MAEAVARKSSIRPDSIINEVTIVIAVNPVVPAPVEQVVIAPESQTNYGVQSIVIQDAPLATDADAAILADYFIRSEPNFWYTGLSINMHALTSPERDSVSTLDIGDFVAVVKTFKFGTPSVVQKNLFVEGINHRITSTTHHIDLYFSPVGFSQPWNAVTPTLAWDTVPSGLTWSNLIWTIL
jgi:hypothetical protein